VFGASRDAPSSRDEISSSSLRHPRRFVTLRLACISALTGFIFSIFPSDVTGESGLARQMPYSRVWRRMSQQVLRITIEENSEAMVLKLEGRLTGPWVTELDRLWEETKPARADRKFALDLRATTFADAEGIRSLREIYRQTSAAILTATPWTQYLAQEIQSAK
jgi:hypothetical protein